MDRDEVWVHKNAKKKGQYPAILTEQAWSIKDETVLLCSDRNSLQPADVRFIFSASSFGLVYNHGKLVIINYHNLDLVLQWLKGSEQLLWT